MLRLGVLYACDQLKCSVMDCWAEKITHELLLVQSRLIWYVES